MQKPSKRTLESLDTPHDHERNVNLSVQSNRWILKLIGVWPGTIEISSIERYSRRILNVVCYSLLLFLMIPCSLYTIFEVEDTYDKIKLIGPISFCVMTVLKYNSLIVHENDIRSCIRCMETDWKRVRHFEDRNVMREYAIFGRRLVTISAFFTYGGAFFFYVAVPASAGRIRAEDDNLTFVPLTLPVTKFVMDIRRSPANEIFLSLQCLSGFVMHSITIGACSLAAVFAMHACGQLEVLMIWLEHFVDGREDLCKNVDGRLAGIVDQHIRILGFLTLTEKILQQISLVEIVGCTLNMCFLGYYTIMESNSDEKTNAVTYVILLFSLTFNIFIFCYIGELVVRQCKKVGDVSYTTDWYRLPGKKSTGLILIIAMSNSSIKLTAGNLIELSLNSFSDVVKTSVAYLNMLRTLTS